jgi:hypothetical protein
MSGSNQHVMQINLRRMERSGFTELPSTISKPKGGAVRAARKVPRRKRCGAALGRAL